MKKYNIVIENEKVFNCRVSAENRKLMLDYGFDVNGTNIPVFDIYSGIYYYCLTEALTSIRDRCNTERIKEGKTPIKVSYITLQNIFYRVLAESKTKKKLMRKHTHIAYADYIEQCKHLRLATDVDTLTMYKCIKKFDEIKELEWALFKKTHTPF